MVIPDIGDQLPAIADSDRPTAVLESALITFARYGYRKTSMEAVARAAHISRPGLYFLFASKTTLFRAAVTHALERDMAAVERVLTEMNRPLRERLLDAFDHWAGRYIGPLTRDVSAVIEENPDLLGAIVETAPRRFDDMISKAISVTLESDSASRISQTLISTSIGIKYQVASRKLYLERLQVALDLLVP